MVKHASLFSQLIALIDRKKFHELVYQHQSERFAKKFNSWDHFVSMFFCQLAQAKSLREICGDGEFRGRGNSGDSVLILYPGL